MPIYEFQCKKCGFIDEVMQKFDDPSPEKCTSCNAINSMHKLISKTSFILKGTGWYETDFKDKNKGKNKSKPNANGKKADTAEKQDNTSSDNKGMDAAGDKKSDSKTADNNPKAKASDTSKKSETSKKESSNSTTSAA